MSIVYILVVVVLLVVAYKLMVASNRKNLSQGREFIAGNADPLKFLCMRISDIKTGRELAGFNFLVMKPWKETRNHFLPYMSKYKNRASLKTNAEREFIEGISADMGITDAFILASEMVPIPMSIGELEPFAYGAWTDLHKQTMDREPNRTIGSYVGISSSAASVAITARLNSSSNRHQ